jgi:hypothetical protein
MITRRAMMERVSRKLAEKRLPSIMGHLGSIKVSSKGKFMKP